ncbi:MAG: hypothetical protein ACO1OQ_09550 [Rufibacter sp.]
MDFDINDFKRRLDQDRARGGNPADFIQRELRKAEQVKAGLTEETDHAADFVSEASNRIDTYVFKLQEIEKQCDPADLSLDQQTNLEDKEVRNRIDVQLKKLEERGEANPPTQDPALRNGKPKNGVSDLEY